MNSQGIGWAVFEAGVLLHQSPRPAPIAEGLNVDVALRVLLGVHGCLVGSTEADSGLPTLVPATAFTSAPTAA